MAANFTDEQLAYTPQQRAEIQQIESAVDKFLADLRTIRYEPTESNQSALLDFLESHNLQVSHANLLFAFDSLGDALELVPFAAPVVQQPPAPSQPPTPVPTAPDPRQPQFYRNGRAIPYTNARPL